MSRLRLITILIAFSVLCLVAIPKTQAQMMMNYGNPSITVNPTEIQQQQQEEAQGKQFFDELQNQQATCARLTDTDFEKIGEYTMSQMFGNKTAAHIAMNQRIQQMRGATGEEQMHTQIGRSVTECSTAASQNTIPRGGAYPMMGWNGYGMMNSYGLGGGLSGFWIAIIHVIIVIDLILLGMWLWKQIKKK